MDIFIHIWILTIPVHIASWLLHNYHVKIKIIWENAVKCSVYKICLHPVLQLSSIQERHISELLHGPSSRINGVCQVWRVRTVVEERQYIDHDKWPLDPWITWRWTLNRTLNIYESSELLNYCRGVSQEESERWPQGISHVNDVKSRQADGVRGSSWCLQVEPNRNESQGEVARNRGVW